MFFKSLLASFRMGYRMVKNAILRPFRSLWYRLRRATSVGRQVSKIVPEVTKSLTKIKIKPEKREDYIDAGPVYVAKSFIVLVIVVLAALFLLIYFVVWPFLQSRYFTADLYVEARKAEEYSGRVRLYGDKGKDVLIFSGRLKDGLKTGNGKEFYEIGNLKYAGPFSDGKYSGEGVLYDEDNKKIYEGGFLDGLYSGKGTLYRDGLVYIEGDFLEGEPEGMIREFRDGRLYYAGEYRSGTYEGQGKLYYEDGETLRYAGGFSAGAFSGMGTEYYKSGAVKYKGGFSMGDYSGDGVEYYENGAVKYQGGFSLGQYSGEGKLFSESGAARYIGGFAQGLYEGEGKLYDEAGTLLYEGSFLAGLYDGGGKLYVSGTEYIAGTFTKGTLSGTAEIYRNGFLYYSGGFTGGVMSGKGVYYNVKGEVVFEGVFINGIVDPDSVIGIGVDEARAMFGSARTADYELEDGLLIVNRDVGLAFFVSYQTEDADPVVHRLYQYTTADFGGKTAADIAPPPGFESDASRTEAAPSIAQIALLDGERRFCRKLTYADYVVSLWSEDASSPVIMVTIVSTSPLPEDGIPPSVLARMEKEKEEAAKAPPAATPPAETPEPQAPSQPPAPSPDDNGGGPAADAA